MRKSNAIEAVLNFVYYTANFPDIHGTLHEIWPGLIGDHLMQKLTGIRLRSGESYISIASVMEFMFELSDAHKAEFADWIEKNYHYNSEHKEAADNIPVRVLTILNVESLFNPDVEEDIAVIKVSDLAPSQKAFLCI